MRSTILYAVPDGTPTTSSDRPGVPAQLRRRAATEVYTVKEVATMLGLSLGSAYVLIRAGEIPAKHLGGRWVIPKRRFHAWLDDEDQADTTEPFPATSTSRRNG